MNYETHPLPYPIPTSHPSPPPRLKQVPMLYSWYFSLLALIILLFLLLFLRKLIYLSLSVFALSKIRELQRSIDCIIHRYIHVF